MYYNSHLQVDMYVIPVAAIGLLLLVFGFLSYLGDGPVPTVRAENDSPPAEPAPDSEDTPAEPAPDGD